MKELGDKEGIEKEINKLQNQKDKLSKELNLSEEDLKSYDEANDLKNEAVNRLEVLKCDKNSLNKIESLFEPKKINYTFSNELIERISNIQERLIFETEKVWNEEKERKN